MAEGVPHIMGYNWFSLFHNLSGWVPLPARLTAIYFRLVYTAISRIACVWMVGWYSGWPRGLRTMGGGFAFFLFCWCLVFICTCVWNRCQWDRLTRPLYLCLWTHFCRSSVETLNSRIDQRQVNETMTTENITRTMDRETASVVQVW